jgi:putative ABC transport system permease protein
MTLFTLILRSARFHARSHLGALLGAAVGSTVLVGALAVGDSVRESLRQIGLRRLGHVQLALASNDRFFRAELADELEKPIDGLAVSALQLSGTASTSDGSARGNRVQLLGVPEKFWTLALEQPSFPQPAPGEVVINDRLATQLKAKPGDTLVMRVSKPSKLSRDAPLAPQEDQAAALRLTVSAIASPEALGRFSLQANQVASFNAFVSLVWLQQQMKLTNRANLLLVGPTESGLPELVNVALGKHWQLADAELELRELPDGAGLELRSRRVFLDAPVIESAVKAAPDASGILTYLVNELRAGDRATPYSMVTAMGPPVVRAAMRDDEIIINKWLAEDLQAKTGDQIELRYYIVTNMRRLEEKTAQFRVREVVSMAGPCADSQLMPDFPGLTDAQNCRDWDAGFAIDTSKIREKDEKYWDDFRGTPKAFVTVAAGQKMWSNRFGNLTAVRYPSGTDATAIQDKIRAALNPASVGLYFEPVRAQALAASGQSQDFGQLFLGFSFFLIVAALLLMSLMFQFGIEQRATEAGTLLALGYTPKQVRRLLLCEGAALAFAGGVLGIAGGVAYARSMLRGLSTIWRDAVGTSDLNYFANPMTLLIGAAAGSAICLGTIWLALRKQARQPAYRLLAEGGNPEFRASNKMPRRSRGAWIGTGALVFAAAMIAIALFQETQSSGTFFGAGALLLIAGLAFTAAGLSARAHTSALAFTTAPTLGQLGLRNAARRRKRSLATLGLLACGSFLIASIGAFRLDADADATKRSAGTGGFAFVGEATLPIVHDLNSEQGRTFFGLNAKDLADVAVVPFRVRDGEDASCLNLNRAQKPRLLGVHPQLLQERQAFTFAQFAKGADPSKPWLLLRNRARDGAIPAIGDQASIQWALGKKVGDILDYTDERGQTFKIRLVASVANSILQGNLIIAEDEFTARFPNEEGYRMFLIDAPSNRRDEISGTLSKALRDYGLELTTASARLAAFNGVQNTYLNTFQVLGGLGLLLGSIGLAVVVLRNVLERRGELALFLAVGFRPRALKWLIVSEHGALLLVGLGLGIVAALVAVLPALLAPGSPLPVLSLGLTLLGVLMSGLVWTWLATRFALRGKLLDALRNE